MSRNRIVTNASAEIASDPARIQRIVDRRLAMRLGMSLSLAAAINALAGRGPRSEGIRG